MSAVAGSMHPCMGGKAVEDVGPGGVGVDEGGALLGGEQPGQVVLFGGDGGQRCLVGGVGHRDQQQPAGLGGERPAAGFGQGAQGGGVGGDDPVQHAAPV